MRNIWNPNAQNENLTQPASCAEMLPCHKCLKEFSENDISAGWCEEFCNPGYVAPSFMAFYGTSLQVGGAVLLAAALVALALIFCQPKTDAESQPLLAK
jgi:hypothetical protein